jgi:hypothetical protein
MSICRCTHFYVQTFVIYVPYVVEELEAAALRVEE